MVLCIYSQSYSDCSVYQTVLILLHAVRFKTFVKLPVTLIPIGLCPLAFIRPFVIRQNWNLKWNICFFSMWTHLDYKIQRYKGEIAKGGHQKQTSKVDIKISNTFDFFCRKWLICPC